MTPPPAAQQGFAWLLFALMTVVAWGLYGVFLHSGQVAMQDQAHGRYKAFLCVGIAYFLTAVLAPAAILALSGAAWSFPAKGIAWSLVAGVVGSVGAFCVLLAFGARGAPSVVMSIIFAGAPIVNAVVALWFQAGHARVRWQFVLGIAFAALGGCLVSLYRPLPAPARPTPPAAESARPTG